MVAIDKKERTLVCSFVDAIVERNLGSVKEGDPVILVKVDVVLEVDFNFLVGVFALAIGFLVEGSAVLHVDLECLTEFLGEIVEESSAAVGDDGVGVSLLSENALE